MWSRNEFPSELFRFHCSVPKRINLNSLLQRRATVRSSSSGRFRCLPSKCQDFQRTSDFPMKRFFEVSSSPHSPLPSFSLFQVKRPQFLPLVFSTSLFLRPQTLQTPFKMSFFSIFPLKKRGESTFLWYLNGNRDSEKGLVGKLATPKESTSSTSSHSRDNRPQPR